MKSFLKYTALLWGILISCLLMTACRDKSEQDNKASKTPEHAHTHDESKAEDGHKHGSSGDHDHEHATGEEHAENDGHENHDHNQGSKSEHDEHGHDHGHEGDSHENEIKLTDDAINRYGIKIETAASRKLNQTLIAPARVAFNAEAMAHIGSPLPGRIAELHVRLGDNVQKGNVLLIVESPELGEAQSEFLQKQILAQTTVASVELAKNSLDRASKLYEENKGIALDEVQKREVEYKSAQAALQTTQAAAMAAENKLHLLGMNQDSINKLRESSEVNPRFEIVAPLAGQVIEREVTLGELVNPEKEALLVLADVTTLWVLADVPEARLHEIKVGTSAWLRSGSVEQHTHEGQVSYIAPMIDPRTRTAQVRIAVKCEHQSLWPGMFVRVEITSTDRINSDASPTVVVPEEAIQTLEGQTVVFVPVPGEENTFTQRPVTVGRTVAGLVTVHNGLTEGESFISAGSFILKAELGKGTAEHEH